MSQGNTPTALEDKALSNEQRAWRWRILIATYFGYAGFYLCRKAFSLVKTSIASDFNIGLDKVAHIWTAYLVAYMVGQFVMSNLGRKWGPRVLLLGGLGVSMVINALCGIANSFWTFMGFMFFNGVVQAAGWPGSVGGVAEWLRKRERGTIMGIWSTNYLVGNIMVKSLGGYILSVYTEAHWPYVFFGCTMAAFIIWWILFFWQRNKPQDVGLEPIVETAKDDESRMVDASDEAQITFRQYLRLLMNPVIPLMGLSYFFLKFLRYALDSWQPTFLDILGLGASKSAYLSMSFDFVGLPGAILAGWALDKWFRGRWDLICLYMGMGMTVGYGLTVAFGGNAYIFTLCCGLIGFMLYGPDTLLAGAAAVQVAGERNAVAVAGFVNGVGSIGPIIQEEVIGQLFKGTDQMANMHKANMLGLGMSITFVLMMGLVVLQVRATKKKRAA